MTVLNAAKNMPRIRNVMEINSLSNDVRFFWLRKKLKIIKIQCRNGRNGSQKPKRDGRKKMKKGPIKSHAFAFFRFFFRPLHSKCRSCDSQQCELYAYRLQEREFFSSCVKPENKYRFTSIRATKKYKRNTHTHKRPTEHSTKKSSYNNNGNTQQMKRNPKRKTTLECQKQYFALNF